MNFKEKLKITIGLLLCSACSSMSGGASGGSGGSVTSTSPKGDAAESEQIRVFPEVAKFVAECRFEDRPFSLSFESKSGEIRKPDMSVTLLFEKNELNVPLAPTWYRAVDATQGFKSLCEGLPAYPLEDTNQVLVILHSEREQAELSALLIDVRAQKILSRLEKFATSKKQTAVRYTVIPADEGFQVKVGDSWKRLKIKKGQLSLKLSSSGKRSKAF
jgi:hypothetical protein